jgi:hypothetical protein
MMAAHRYPITDLRDSQERVRRTHSRPLLVGKLLTATLSHSTPRYSRLEAVFHGVR